jgi:hypothetical protein
VGDRMQIWKPSLIIGTILTLFSYSKNLSSYNGYEPSFDPWSPPSCSRISSPPAQTQPPAPQDRSLESGLVELYSDECNAVYSEITPNPNLSVNASCTGVALDGTTSIDLIIKNNDTSGFSNVRMLVKSISDPTVLVDYPTAVTSTGCADANGCKYLMIDDILEMGESVTKEVRLKNPTGVNFTFETDHWGT